MDGAIEAGSKVKVYSKLSPGRAFPVKVAEFEPNSRMTWTGGMPLGLFKGVRTFVLTPEGPRVKFELREVFSGPMLPLVRSSLPDMREAFEKFCAGLKSRSEAFAS